jgi:hypothetical protein
VKFKLVPEAPETLDDVADAQRAIPLVPGSEDDCCARLMRREDFPSRDVARTWLTFLRALELVAETDSGFVRLDTDPTDAHLRAAFVERIYGAEELLRTLDDEGPLTADDAFEGFETRVPVWEHYKNPSRWQTIWRDRVETILEWFTLLGLAEKTDAGYVAAATATETIAEE